MKSIPRINLSDAHILTPAEMNAIHFETGLHSAAPAPKADKVKISPSRPNK